MMHPAAAYVRAIDWPAFEPDRHPETRRWIERIEAARREVEPPKVRRCGCCDETKPLGEFPRDPNMLLGRAYRCKSCHAEQTRVRRRERKRRAFRTLLGRAS